jgi:hypothetical protein
MADGFNSALKGLIQPEHECLLLETAKRYFTRLWVEENNDYKIVSKAHNVCKQPQPVQLTFG